MQQHQHSNKQERHLGLNSSPQDKSTFVAHTKGKSLGRGRPHGKGKGNRKGIMPVKKGEGEPNG